MEPLYYPEWLIRRILRDTNIIAMVGASSNWNRPSYFAMKYLQSKGYRIIPVNPTISGTKLLGENVYANLKDIPEKTMIVAKEVRGPKVGVLDDILNRFINANSVSRKDIFEKDIEKGKFYFIKTKSKEILTKDVLIKVILNSIASLNAITVLTSSVLIYFYIWLKSIQ